MGEELVNTFFIGFGYCRDSPSQNVCAKAKVGLIKVV